ncbi:LysR substrate-binding domain-containing protein [Glaciimonas sp. PCH181]|uniref:LysR substrate-binding domain-containing protein n=1 Tax=Glaciimonas sp. PCH181 TaxID=2133943 RepID=UPI000D344CD1|nr:LysR substrate-binding domain-containing protein [Glaciimonas sp. PCH181]PUA18698.1 transcriptional regulator LrhA [Glaciimonas sp. PCH181]
MKNLDIELLRTFVTVVGEQTFSRAGIKIGKTQAAVTQQMQRLEAIVGLPLFQKNGRNKALTAHGHQLQSYARELLLLNDDAMRLMSSGGHAGVLRIGCPHDVSDTLLPPILSHIARWAPNLRLELDVGRSPFLMDALHRGEIDMTISTRRDPALEGLLLRTSPTAWICASQYVHEPGSPLPLVLADEPSIFGRLAIEALDAAHVRWRKAYVTSNLLGIKAAIRAQLGVTARSIELLGPEMRVLGDSDGLPRLPDVNYYLWKRPGNPNPLVRDAFALLKRNLPGKNGTQNH